MNKKKITYTIGAVVVLVLGYFNYFGEEKKLEEVKKVVETTNAVYESDEYYVEAEKEYDFIDEKESKFEKAKAKIKGMILSGDNVLLDKARNLILNSNIVGISPNGWEINTSELKYEKLTDEITSNKPLIAKNEKKGVEISGNKFKTTLSMDNISLEDNVVIKNKIISLKCDRANYSDKTHKILLEGNISIASDAENEKITGKFSKAHYNLDERNLYVDDGFEIEYEGVQLNGTTLVLNDLDEALIATGDIKFKYQDYIFEANKIEKKKDSQVINLYGIIKGGNEVYKLRANSGTYNLDTQLFSLIGNIEATSINEEKFVADKIEYSLKTKDVKAYGNLLKYTSPTNNIEAEYITYNSEFKIISTDKNFYAYDKVKGSVRGSDFVYNMNSGDFKAVNKTTLSNKDYEIRGSNVTYVAETGELNIPESYELTSIENNNKVIGKKLIYNRNSGDLKSPNPLKLIFKNSVIEGQNLTYNSNSNLGKIEGPINLESSDKTTFGSGKEILMKSGDFIEMLGPISISKNGTNILTENLKYLYSDSLLHIDNEITIKDDKGMSGKAKKAVYNPDSEVLKAFDFSMNDKDKNIKSGVASLYNSENKIEFSKNVVISSKNNTIKTENIVYYQDSEDIEINSKNEILSEGYSIKSEYAKINQNSGDINMKNANIKSPDNNTFYADKIYGNINSGLIHFVDNVKAKVYNKNEAINFSGEMLDLYVNKVADKFEMKKLIMNKSGVFTQLNRKLETNNIEADLQKKIIYLKNRPIVTINNKDGDTIIKSDEAKVFVEAKILNLDGNIYVKDFNKNKEEIIMTANRADLKNNIASVYENVRIVNKESVLRADRGHYNLDSKKIKLIGNVHVDYKTEKGAKK